MATRVGRCFVYVRYWPGFTDSFPYERFNGLSDNDVLHELRHALAKELWSRRSEITRRRHEAKRRRIEAIKARRAQFLGRPTGSFHHPQPPPPKPRKTRCSRFARLAQFVGWHEVGGYFLRKSGEFLFSPRIWIAELESAECANDLVKELTELRPVNDQEWERHRLLNPRCGQFSCDDLSRGAQASVLADIQDLSSNEPFDWSDLVWPLLPRVNRFLAAWRAIATTDSGQRRGGIHRDKGTEARDKWIYEECCKLKAYKLIIAQLRQKPKAWERIESVPGIKRAAKAYAVRHNLELPPARKSGRKPC